MISVVISARNDPIGCLFTARSLLEEAKRFNERFEVVIVDNSDNEQDWEMLKLLIDPEYRIKEDIKLIKDKVSCIFTARDLGVYHAKGDHIIILDSHMMLGRNSLNYFMKCFEEEKDVGVAYGPLVYHNKVEENAFHSRNIYTFAPVQFKELKQDHTKIPFRGAPFGFRKDFYQEINGYGALSEHKFSWGGGDAYLGIKSLMFGKTNYLIKNFIGIHIGPFKDDPFLYKSSEYERIDNKARWVGILVAGYILGGEELLQARVNRVRRRLEKFENFDERFLHNVRMLGESERRWIRENAKLTFKEVQSKWQNVS